MTKAIQIAVSDGLIFALRSDGAIFRLDSELDLDSQSLIWTDVWKQIIPLPSEETTESQQEKALRD